ncbi:MAG: phytanoyl-CoA dioxygenase family protein [Chitinophagales bacterium]
MGFQENKQELEESGFSVIAAVYTESEIAAISVCMDAIDSEEASFMKTKNLFAVRQLLKNVPALKPLLFTKQLMQLIEEIGGKDYFLTKAMYLDKPKDSNWFVPYHQDLSISVNKKVAIENYNSWTFKRGQFGVQPPADILEKTITIRIHLDDTDENNGALKVIPKSHLKGVRRFASIDDSNKESGTYCNVKNGGVMLMKPLTFHASSRAINERQRRVIHLEFCNQPLVKPLEWAEKLSVFY